MSTLVCVHAHPDDESILTAGTMGLAARDGHRVVLVVATRGELGEPVPGVLTDGETLGERREAETHRAAEVLGVERVEFLGYRDSGMMGDPTNDDPMCFWQADIEEAASRLAALLTEVDADVLTIYDDHGGYGHPDHIQVYRVGMRAAELAAVDAVYLATANRDQIVRSRDLSAGVAALPDGVDPDDLPTPPPELDLDTFGTPETAITHAVDVRDVIELKRAAMATHASQIAADSFFLALPSAAFAFAFGTEWYVAVGAARADGQSFVDSLFPG
ncbi:MAG TPA: PIG-L family deacetylase [Acidimicrobiales bacterium]